MKEKHKGRLRNEDILLPGAKLTAFKIDPKKVKELVRESEKKQLELKKLKRINPETGLKIVDI